MIPWLKVIQSYQRLFMVYEVQKIPTFKDFRGEISGVRASIAKIAAVVVVNS